ncbi:hypothetical protein ZIOFF_049389 [Zingiber officinale]|uniref:Uncharacterized protein n=1 Tax=Zingiber officinale TaxID=94328 RepID=A0A8J5FV25_ZINOF|nr:hypothetical protein ZIOFF_049389 [Zingiber officinale]
MRWNTKHFSSLLAIDYGHLCGGSAPSFIFRSQWEPTKWHMMTLRVKSYKKMTIGESRSTTLAREVIGEQIYSACKLRDPLSLYRCGLLVKYTAEE